MTALRSIESVALESPDPAASGAFLEAAFGLTSRQVAVRGSEAPTSGFRGFTMSLVVSQPSTVDSLVGTALEAGATTLKPVARGFWGYGGVVQAPDGAIWKLATSSKRENGPATRQVDDLVLLLGVADVKASKRFYVEHGMTVARSFGSKYVEFESPTSHLKLGLYGRRALAKDAGVPGEGTGSHRIVIGGSAERFVDPDGFAWETVSHPVRSR